MRVGYNPHKNVPIGETAYTHQIIVPVYIPNFDGYFKDGLTILQFCMQSIEKTIHAKTFVTVVNNGSCAAVVDYLNGLLSDKKINELIHSENIGKPNAILKGLSGNDIEIVTVCDADTLFLPGWQQETAKIFQRIPKAGIVGLVPMINTYRAFSGNTLFDNFFNKKLQFLEIPDQAAFFKFYESINRSKDDINFDWGKYMLCLDWADDLKVILGGGHFVLTYKKDVFTELKTYLGHKLGGKSEEYLDLLALEKDYWRLTTYHNFAYHMGNVTEDWMQKELENMIPVHTETPSGFAIRKPMNHSLRYFKNRVFIKFIKIGWMYRFFLKWKKLPESMRAGY